MRQVQTLAILFIFIATARLFAQSNENDQVCYHTGETIAGDVAVVDKNGRSYRLLDLVEPDTRLIYLVLFGGPGLNADRTEGGLWCGDSFNDMPISNFNYRKYAGQGVKFIPVVCPLVYHERYFGFEKGVFMKAPDASNTFQEAFQKYVAATQKLQASKIIPFDEVYYDPHFRLMFNFDEMQETSEYVGKDVPWLGKLKPCGDLQRYSTPTIWLLSPEGEVLHEPFFGNRFAKNRLQIKFTVREVDAAIAELLEM